MALWGVMAAALGMMRVIIFFIDSGGIKVRSREIIVIFKLFLFVVTQAEAAYATGADADDEPKSTWQNPHSNLGTSALWNECPMVIGVSITKGPISFVDDANCKFRIIKDLKNASTHSHRFYYLLLIPIPCVLLSMHFLYIPVFMVLLFSFLHIFVECVCVWILGELETPSLLCWSIDFRDTKVPWWYSICLIWVKSENLFIIFVILEDAEALVINALIFLQDILLWDGVEFAIIEAIFVALFESLVPHAICERTIKTVWPGSTISICKVVWETSVIERKGSVMMLCWNRIRKNSENSG